MRKAKVWVEPDTFFEHKGRRYEAGGAVITPDWAVGYLGKKGVLTDWHGNSIGTYKIVSSWPTPQSFVSSRMYQVEAVVDDVVYTGRSAGEGMIFKGKRKKTKQV